MGTTRLSHKDFDLLSTCLQQIYACLDTESLPVVGLEVLAHLVPCDTLGYNDANELGQDFRVITRGYPEDEATQYFPILIEHKGEHPPYVYHLEQDPTGRKPLMISDFLSLRQFQRRAIYQEFYRHLDIRYQITFWPPAGNFGLHRWHRDFSERDRCILEHFNRHYTQAWNNAVAYGQLASRTAALVEPSDARSALAKLTPRETEVLKWIAEGKSNPVIAKILDMKERTVHKHVERILEKLGVENRREAMRQALRMGALPPHET